MQKYLHPFSNVKILGAFNLTEIKLCIKLVLYFVSETAFTHAGQLCSSTDVGDTAGSGSGWRNFFYYSYLPEQIPLSGRQHEALLLL